MAKYENILVDTDTMEPGKFYRIYADSNATTLLIEKGTPESENENPNTEQGKISIQDSSNSINTVNSANSVINVYDSRFLERKCKKVNVENTNNIAIPYTGEIVNVKVYNLISNVSGVETYEQVEDSVLIQYQFDKNTSEKKIVIKTTNPVTGYVKLFTL